MNKIAELNVSIRIFEAIEKDGNNPIGVRVKAGTQKVRLIRKRIFWQLIERVKTWT